jgi:hygromycin-B 4-O-kinase
MGGMAVEFQIDVLMAMSFLDAHYGGTAVDVTLLGEGAWSKAFAFRGNGQELLVRFGAFREDFEKDQYATMFAGPDLPVPKVLEIGQAFDGAYAISERHFGNFLEELDIESLRTLTAGLLRLFDAMREFPIDQQASAEWPAKPKQHLSWTEWLANSVVDDGHPRTGGWRHELAKNVELDALFNRGVDMLHSLLRFCPPQLHLIHGDLLNRNVLVSDAALRIEAVFDWGCSTYGDFLYDIAWFTFCSPWHNGLKELDIRTLLELHYKDLGLDVPNFSERLACYELQIGLTNLAHNTVIKNPDTRIDVAKQIEKVLIGLQ